MIALAGQSFDIGVVTTDPQRMLHFYRDVLGLRDVGELQTRPESGSAVRQLRCGSGVLKLISLAVPPANRATSGGVPAATGIRLITLHVEDLEDAVAECAAAGVRVIAGPKQVNPTTRVAIVEDPDGNAVEFMTSTDAAH